MSEAPDRKSQDSLRSLAKRTGITGLVILLMVVSVLVIGYAYRVFLLSFGGLLLAVLLRGLAMLLSERTHLSPSVSLVVVLMLVLSLGGIALWVVAPHVSTQVDELAARIPESLQQLRDWLSGFGWGQRLIATISHQYQNMLERGTFISRTTSSVYWLIWAVTGFIMVVFIGLYLAANPDLYRRGLVRVVPASRRGRTAEVMQAVEHVLSRWLLGKAISMSIVGVLTGAGLWALGIPLALTLAIIAALLAFIPNFGPVISALPAVLLSLLQNPIMALYVALLYLGVQLVESYLVTPLIQKWAVSLPPVLLIVFQVLMGVLAGTLGLIFATPLLAVLLVLVEMLYIQDFLGEQIEVAGGSGNNAD